MSSLILGWLANHWLLIAALVVGIAAIAQPVIVWKFKAWILLAVVLWWGWTGHAAADAGRAQAERIIADFAKAEAAAQARVRQAEHDHADALDKIAAQYEQDKDDAKAAADAIAAGLRAGTAKLRDHWQGCQATSAVIAATGQPDESARLRAESAARIIAAADEADAQIRGLQRVIEADRK